MGFGLHANAEIGFKLREAEMFCMKLLSLQVLALLYGDHCLCPIMLSHFRICCLAGCI